MLALGLGNIEALAINQCYSDSGLSLEGNRGKTATKSAP